MSGGGSERRAAWLALAAVEGIGPAAFGRLVGAWGEPVEVLRRIRRSGAGPALACIGHRGEGPRSARLAAGLVAAAVDPGRTAAALDAIGGWALVPTDHAWPPALRVLDDPPLALYGLGRVDLVGAAPAVAIVGTRRASPEGVDAARRSAVAAVRAGASVVSGLALGVDAVAHATALAAGGATVAVVGGGLGRAWPARNARLAHAIARGRGAIVGELPPGSAPTVGTFPRRNRLISALADIVLVAEAPERSGALLTARHALEQGRLLLVVPGPADHAGYAGCRSLLADTPAVALPDPAALLAMHPAARTGGGGSGAPGVRSVPPAPDDPTAGAPAAR
ncbi:MAG: DNA-processing protein DprA, partial [Chloroflexota bacterium]